METTEETCWFCGLAKSMIGETELTEHEGWRGQYHDNCWKDIHRGGTGLMRVTGISAADVDRITAMVSSDLYGGNLRAEIRDEGCGPRTGPRCSFVLRVRDSKASGARRSASGRRTVAACWHAHRDVLNELFYEFPTARVRTALADYRGAAGFQDVFPDTYWTNAGSMMSPAMFGELCECDALDRSQREATVAALETVLSVGVDASRVAALADEELAAWDEILKNARTKKTV